MPIVPFIVKKQQVNLTFKQKQMLSITNFKIYPWPKIVFFFIIKYQFYLIMLSYLDFQNHILNMILLQYKSAMTLYSRNNHKKYGNC